MEASLSPKPASVDSIAEADPDPFRVLVGTIISLRTRDEVTLAASMRLLEAAPDATSLAAMDEARIAQLIYPAGFFRTKARHLRTIAGTLVSGFGSTVPRTMTELLTLPGVGRKTANLVLGLGHGVPAICVDVHVHRIPNRLGLISTRTPEQSEAALEELLPRHLWIRTNSTLVRFGQQICTPVSPWCSRCPVADECQRVGVTRSR